MNGDFTGKCAVTREAAGGDGLRNIYVASSWRNHLQPRVVEVLRSLGHWVYDFKRPSSTAGRSFNGDPWTIGRATTTDYVAALSHPAAVQGFERDFEAMLDADTFVLVLPCGRSAHLELGWAVGAGRRSAILLDDPCTPELMYRMVDKVATSLDDLVQWLAANDSQGAARRSDDASDRQCTSEILNQQSNSEWLTRVMDEAATYATPPRSVDPRACVGEPAHSDNDTAGPALEWLAELEPAGQDFGETDCGGTTAAVDAQTAGES